MSDEKWQEGPSWTVDRVRKLGRRIKSLVRTNKFASRVSSILMLILMIEFALWMYMSFPIFGIVIPTTETISTAFLGTFFITIMVAMVVYVVAGSIRGRLNHLLQVFRKVGVIIGTLCSECNRTGERTWAKGDFVFKEEGTCACGGSTYVSKMYLMPLPIKIQNE